MECVEIGTARLYHGDCMEVLPLLSKVDAVVCDPPYMGVVADEWDNQWQSDAEFLEYMAGVIGRFDAVLVDNGSLYMFASSRMASRVELQVREKFNILNNIVWSKGASRKGAAGTGIDVTALRRFWTASTERIIFAEKYGAAVGYEEAQITGDSTFSCACEKAKLSIIGGYLKDELARAGKTNKEIAALFPSKTGGLTGCVSNWLNGLNFPTADQYQKIRKHLNGEGQSQYLRREYEDLRRPFNAKQHMQWTELWEFGLPKDRTGHPCEKPESLMSHIIQISSREGGTIADFYMGSGTTGVSCVNLNRKFVGVERDRRWFDIACERIHRAQQQLKLSL